MKYLVEFLQICCILSVITGVIIEVAYGAHSGFILITIASLIFALSEKYNRFKLKRKLKSNNNDRKQ